MLLPYKLHFTELKLGQEWINYVGFLKKIGFLNFEGELYHCWDRL